MKYILLTLALVFTACSSTITEPETQCKFILSDLTDSMSVITELSEKAICKGLLVTRDTPEAGAIVHFIPITNLRFTKETTVSIPPDMHQDNEFERKVDIDTFRVRLHATCEAVKSSKRGINGSAIFETLARVLQTASESKNLHPDIALLSDLRQNSPLCNTYDAKQLKSFLVASEARSQWFDSVYNIPSSLSGITIRLIHLPTNVYDDFAFYVLSYFLQTYLEEKGAEVYIQTSF